MEDVSVLLLDIGNSQVKWVLAGASAVIQRGRTNIDELDSLRSLQPQPSVLLCSCVASLEHEQRVRSVWSNSGPTPWFATSTASLGGLKNSYAEPTLMGVDRWLAMLGVWRRKQERFCVVDAGSALTIDFVGSSGEHEGGFIIPGRALMKRALLNDTERVRFGELEATALSPGTSTAEAVEHGLLLAQCGSISLAIDKAELNGELGAVYLCGGDAPELTAHILRTHVVAPDLVFEGLVYQALLQGVLTPEQEPQFL